MSQYVHDMFASIAHRYDCANDVLSFGMHRLWRERALDFADVKTGQTAVDLCTGTGDVAFALAKRVGPSGKVIGVDFVESMLEQARLRQANTQTSSKSRLPSADLSFIRGDALSIPVPDNSADLVTVSFGIRNVDDPLKCLREMKRILKPGGKAIILEFGKPTFPGFGLLFRLYSSYLMPLIGGVLTGNREAYSYLPRTSREFPAGKEFTLLMEQAQLTGIKFKPLLYGVAYIYKGEA